MYCSNCGANIPEWNPYCLECGCANTPAVQETAHPMKWYKFLIYFSLYLAAAINFMTGLTQLTGKHYGIFADDVYTTFPMLKPVDMAMGLAVIAAGAFSIFTRFRLARFKKDGPTCLTINYLLNIIISVIYVIAAAFAVGDMAPQILSSTIVSNLSSFATTIVMLVVNYIYFEKRADLFIH